MTYQNDPREDLAILSSPSAVIIDGSASVDASACTRQTTPSQYRRTGRGPSIEWTPDRTQPGALETYSLCQNGRKLRSPAVNYRQPEQAGMPKVQVALRRTPT